MVIGYCSSATKDDKKILEQEKQILSASGMKREEVTFFSDNGVSGLRIENKPELMRICELINSGKVKKLYVTSLRVLTRNNGDLLDILYACKSANTKLCMIDSNEDLYSLILKMNMLNSFN